MLTFTSLPIFRAMRGALSILLLGASFAATPAMAQSAPATAASSPATKRFATDDAVREGMVAVRTLMAAQEARIAQNQLSANDYVQLAHAIEAPMQSRIAKRSLPKAAAVAFNGSIWQDLSYCVGLMRDGRSVAVQRTGAFGVQQVLRNYPEYFEHPGW
jgi:hypothetical protein